MNDKLIFHSNRYNGGHNKEAGNIFLLNGFSFSRNKFLYPFKGEITDLNIWKKTLSMEDMHKWGNCNFGSGNLVNWNEARFKLNNIEVTEVDKDQICQIKNRHMVIPFSKKMNFNETIKFCQEMGGQVAVAEDSKKLEIMVEAFLHSDERCLSRFYSGYWNRNGWKNANNDEKLKLDWNNWSSENTYYNSCAIIDTKSLKFGRKPCTQDLCPICLFEDRFPEMQLRGADIEETKHMDSQFYLVNSTHIIGKTRSSIVFQNNEWHIKTGMKSVYTTSGKMVPLGIQEWNGTEGATRTLWL